MITLYSVSEDRESIVALGPDGTQGGRFRKAGKVVEFPEGRTPITGLAVTRTSLNAAIYALMRLPPDRADTGGDLLADGAGAAQQRRFRPLVGLDVVVANDLAPAFEVARDDLVESRVRQPGGLKAELAQPR